MMYARGMSVMYVGGDVCDVCGGVSVMYAGVCQLYRQGHVSMYARSCQ